MNKEAIFSKYKDKILAVESFGNNRKKFVSDFSNIDGLLYELQQLNNHELTLTDDGLRFLDEYYGLDKVVDMILERVKEGVDYKYKTREDLLKWLKNKGE
ncbi:MAG: hypothetical protein WC715_06245 [Patescibacteria group bacterium]|jgi:hypothetical protein